MKYLTESFLLLSMSSAVYVVWASCCRLRHKDISKVWATLYTAVLSLALFTMVDLAKGSATLRDGAIVVSVAAYIFMTRKSWLEGVPKVAKRGFHEQ